MDGPEKPSPHPVCAQRRHAATMEFNRQVLEALTDLSARLQTIERHLSHQHLGLLPGLDARDTARSDVTARPCDPGALPFHDMCDEIHRAPAHHFIGDDDDEGVIADETATETPMKVFTAEMYSVAYDGLQLSEDDARDARAAGLDICLDTPCTESRWSHLPATIYGYRSDSDAFDRPGSALSLHPLIFMNVMATSAARP